MRFFNTTGPVKADKHYCISAVGPPEPGRGPLADPRGEVLRPPRAAADGQDLFAAGLRDLLNAEGEHRCVYVNVEAAQALREDVERSTQIILGELASRARLTLATNS